MNSKERARATHRPDAVIVLDRMGFDRPIYLFTFWCYSDVRIVVVGGSAEDGLDECVYWLAEHKPGLLADEQVLEAYQSAIREGKSEEEAQEEAETDVMICDGGHYLLSWEWTVDELVGRKDRLAAIWGAQ